MNKHLNLFISVILVITLACVSCKPEKELPKIITHPATNIKATSATLGGNISFEGEPPYTEKGICFAKTIDPTISDNKVIVSGIKDVFSVDVTELSPNTTYYARAYAINSLGTAYGNTINFSTFEIPLTFTVNGVSFNMILVENGTFTMGCTDGACQEYFPPDTPVHHVTLTKDYYIGETEVTQGLWVAVMGYNPSYFQEGNNYPVEWVSWNEIQEFLIQLNNLTGKTFRLPTEAEWEYAARGGKKSKGYKYSGSNNVDKVAWWTENSNGSTHPVASKMPNELGIYDMSGNVFEICSDWTGEYSADPKIDPTGPESGYSRICRGGCWWFIFEWELRVASRSYIYSGSPDEGSFLDGFRLVLVP